MLLLPLLAFLGLLARAKVVLCAQEECFRKVGTEGGEIVLSPRTEIKGNEISFKKGGNIVAEWDSTYTYFPPLVGRAHIDINSSSLTISKLSQDDAGNYKEEITVEGVVHTICFNLEIQEPLEPPVLHCMVVNGSIRINCTSEIQDSQLKYEWKYAKMEDIDDFEQPAIHLKNTKHSGNITCVITLHDSNASNSISLSNCVSTESADQTRNRTGLILLVLLLLLPGLGLGIIFYRRRHQRETCVSMQTPGNSSNKDAIHEPLNADNRDETENSGQINSDG